MIMKRILQICLILFCLQKTFSQQQQSYVYIDENGEKINSDEFNDKWGNKDLMLSRWDSIGKDGIRYRTLKQDLHMIAELNFKSIVEHFKSNYVFPLDSTNTIMISYHYKDDLCSSSDVDNKFTVGDIISLKHDYSNSIRKKLKKDNIVYLAL